MKTLLVSLSCICLSHVLLSQTGFAPPGATWHFPYDEYQWGGQFVQGIETVEYSGDIDINGIPCKIISAFQGPYYVYQQGQQVYYSNGGKIPGPGDFQLLYDFSLQPGEFFTTTNLLGGGVRVHLLSIDQDTLNGVPINVFHCIMGCEWVDGTLIDSIGLTYNDRFGAMNQYLFYPVSECVLDYPRRYTLRCYEDDTLGLFNPGGTPCDQVLGSTDPHVSTTTSVQPNPFQDRLTFNMAPSISEKGGTIRLFNQTGHLVATKATGQGETGINTTELPDGIYYWVVADDSGRSVKSGCAIKIDHP